MREIVVTPEAYDDVKQNITYIAQFNPHAAIRIHDELFTKIENLVYHPFMYGIGRIAHTREMVGVAGFLIIYSVTDTEMRIRRVIKGAQQSPPKNQ